MSILVRVMGVLALVGVVFAAIPAAATTIPGQIENVPFARQEFPVGSIIIVNKERKLYLVMPDGMARRYPVAIGIPDEQWVGRETISDKREDPKWIEPDEDGEGDVIEGGDQKNPLGKRAIYLGRTLWRIHGTIAPWSIGKAASNGCIRMHNDDVIDLYDRIDIGTEVFVVDRIADPRPERRGRKVVD